MEQYGFSIHNSGQKNSKALQKAVDEGGTIFIRKPGIYEISDTIYIGDDTELRFGAGVKIKRSKNSRKSFAFANKGALTKTYNQNITLAGLHLITDGVEARSETAVYGLIGEVSFFYVKNLKIFDFTCLDLPSASFGIHICTFENILIDRVLIEGEKDGVHLGRGSKFTIRNGLFRTFDDPIALNAHDYAIANPELGWIQDGVIENCYDLNADTTTGYFCRILAGSWCDWFAGMEIQNSDTIVHNNRVYRAAMIADGTIYNSINPPTHTQGVEVLDGIRWLMVQEDVIYNCGCKNIHFKDIFLQKKRDTAFSIHFDDDNYSRSYYPKSHAPVQENIIFENIYYENEIPQLITAKTPVDCIKIVNSAISNSEIALLEIKDREFTYEPVNILLSGVTFMTQEQQLLVSCEGTRSANLSVMGSLLKNTNMQFSVDEKVEIKQADIMITKVHKNESVI